MNSNLGERVRSQQQGVVPDVSSKVGQALGTQLD